jgi:hypothetical protein
MGATASCRKVMRPAFYSCLLYPCRVAHSLCYQIQRCGFSASRRVLWHCALTDRS